MAKTPLYAVLTGDLVGSTKLAPDHLRRIREEIEAGAQAIAGWRPGLLAGGPEFFRGDAWQLALSDPSLFLRASVYLRARLLALQPQSDTRIAIGLGPVERLEREVSHSVGSAFTLSGRMLDQMKGRRAFGVAAPGEDAVPWLPPLLSLCDALVSRWKPEQARIAAAALEPFDLTQEEIGARVGRSQKLVSRAFVATGLRPVGEAIAFVESRPWQDVIEAGS